MRTPVVLVCGQTGANTVADALLAHPGTAVVEHEFDGQVVRRWVAIMRQGKVSRSEVALELTKGCVSCTTRDDLLVLLRRVQRRDDVHRIVVILAQWTEPESICHAINHVPVRVGVGYLDGPAARDVEISAVVTCLDTEAWRRQALGDDELPDGRPVAQVVVDQAEFADVLVLTEPEHRTLAILKRLAPRARVTVGHRHLEIALRHLHPLARRGADSDAHEPLLAGEPPLAPDGDVALTEFTAQRPFHPGRLHAALDVLLDGVIRSRGRIWLAPQPDNVVWVESAGGGLRVAHTGPWLAAMAADELAYVDPERKAIAAMRWNPEHGDRHTSMTILSCGARPIEISAALHDALLTDDEFGRPWEWNQFDDPFGDWHEDPCDSTPELHDEVAARGSHEGDDK